MDDGDYQSCLGCDVYATCSNELLYDERPCPANLVWDDNAKRCEYESATCSENGGDNGGNNGGGDDGEDNEGGGQGGGGGHSNGSHSSSSEDSHDRDDKR